ncbi:MAG: gfo/Idh/MocA family oxidoreductase, partial [Prevotellaceae bacterium]|nr:gfo/Idh/MocA family oxidoreductase [Prevotellaceae bacterium]
FSMEYVYADSKTMLATNRQMNGCTNEISEKIYGTKGVAILNDWGDSRIVDRDGNIIWKLDKENNPVKNPYEQEHVHLVESIRLNKPINQGEDLAYSSMIAMMGRESAYSGKTVTWDEIMASDLRYGPTKYEMGPVPEYVEGRFPIPGIS